MVCTGFPQVNPSKIERIRNSDDFYEDQIRFKDYLENKVIELREKRIEATCREVRDRPEISKKSEELSKLRNADVEGDKIYPRLHSASHNTEVKHFINKEKADKKRRFDLKMQKDFSTLYYEGQRGLPQHKLVII